jgi:hypothetical protein
VGTAEHAESAELNGRKTMRSPAKRVLTGAAIAIIVALMGIVPRIGRIDTWKIVLGLLGVALFIVAGREPRKDS